MEYDVSNLWDEIIELGIANEGELQLVTDINGYSVETLNDIIYARTGYNDIYQVKGEDTDEN